MGEHLRSAAPLPKRGERARRGEPPATGDEELLEGSGQRGAEGQVARHYGGGDVYLRRRLIALAAVIVVIVLIFLIVGGC